MAGNNLLRILRASNDTIASSSEILEPGQVLHNKTYNYLTVGASQQDAEGSKLNSLPIAARELIGFTGDSEEIVPDADKGGEFHLKYKDNSLELLTPDNFVCKSNERSILEFNSTDKSLGLRIDDRGSSELYRIRCTTDVDDKGIYGYITFVIDEETGSTIKTIIGSNILVGKSNLFDFYMFNVGLGTECSLDRIVDGYVKYNGTDLVPSTSIYTFKSFKNMSKNDVYIEGTIIPDSALLGNDFAEIIDISRGVTSIGGQAFKNTSKVKSIYVPETVTYVGDNWKSADGTSDYMPAIVNFNGPAPSNLKNDIPALQGVFCKSEYAEAYEDIFGSNVYSGNMLDEGKFYASWDELSTIDTNSSIKTTATSSSNLYNITNSGYMNSTAAVLQNDDNYPFAWIESSAASGTWEISVRVRLTEDTLKYIKGAELEIYVEDPDGNIATNSDGVAIISKKYKFTKSQMETWPLNGSSGDGGKVFEFDGSELYDLYGWDNCLIYATLTLETYNSFYVDCNLTYGTSSITQGKYIKTTVQRNAVDPTIADGHTIQDIIVENLSGTQSISKGGSVAGFNTRLKVVTSSLAGFFGTESAIYNYCLALPIVVKFGDYTV